MFMGNYKEISIMKIGFGGNNGDKFVVQAQMFDTLEEAENYIDKNIDFLNPNRDKEVA